MEKQQIAIKLNYVREYNVDLILNLLYKQPLSCLEISEKIGISDVGVRKIVKQLETQGLLKIAQENELPRKKGNQHIRYTINAAFGVFLIIDFTHLSEKFTVFDYAGQCLLEKRFSIPYVEVNDEDLCRLIQDIKKTISDVGLDKKRLLNIQLSVPGQIDEQARCFTISHRFKKYENDYSGLFFRIFEDAFGVSVFAKNNVAYMAMGETEHGFSSKYGSAIYIFAGYGIAASVLYKGNIVSGWRGYAGEIGGSKYGKDSTLSLNCSVLRLIYKCSPYLETQDFEGLMKAYRTNETVKSIILESAEVLGAFISAFANLIGSDIVMLGGESLNYGKEYLGKLTDYVKNHTIAKTDVLFSSLKDAAIWGALIEARKQVVADYNAKKRAEAETEK